MPRTFARRLDLILLGWCWDIRNLMKPPGHANMQPGLGTPYPGSPHVIPSLLGCDQRAQRFLHIKQKIFIDKLGKAESMTHTKHVAWHKGAAPHRRACSSQLLLTLPQLSVKWDLPPFTLRGQQFPTWSPGAPWCWFNSWHVPWVGGGEGKGTHTHIYIFIISLQGHNSVYSNWLIGSFYSMSIGLCTWTCHDHREGDSLQFQKGLTVKGCVMAELPADEKHTLCWKEIW